MVAIEQVREKYFKKQYVELISKPDEYWSKVENRDQLIVKPVNGKTPELDFKLTTLALDPEHNRLTQYFTDHSLFSLLHEMGHFVSVDLDQAMKPAYGLPFVHAESDPNWIDTFAIPQEISAFCYEAVLMSVYDPTYRLSTRYITFNSVLNMSKAFKAKYGGARPISELHPTIQKIFDDKRKDMTIEKFDELWFARNQYFLENPVIP